MALLARPSRDHAFIALVVRALSAARALPWRARRSPTAGIASSATAPGLA